MSQEAKKEEFSDVRKKRNEKKRSTEIFFDILKGKFLADEAFIHQLPYIFFLAALGIVYIANSYHAEKKLREQKQLELQLRELLPEALTISAQLMKISNQTEVVKLCKAKENGLKENIQPPVKIVLNPRDKRKITHNKLSQ